MKDAAQKELLYRHFRARGWYALAEVPVYHRSGAFGSKYLITDIDVFALRPSSDLRWEPVIGDCKTKKGESPANRVLWARALMDQFGAASGIVLLQRDPGKEIEPDHKLFAQKLGIALIEEPDFEVYDRAMLYPSGSGSGTFPESVAALKTIRTGTIQRFPKLEPLGEYINARAWNEPDHLTMLRNSLGNGRKVSTEIDPARNDHLAIVLEAAGVFAVGLATCVGIVFHQYPQTNDRQALDSALKTIIWGGREQYSYISGIFAKLVEAKGGAKAERDLSLPIWQTFLQLVRSHTDAPHFSFQIPQLLRIAALDVMGSRPFLASLGSPDPMLLKLGSLTAAYFIDACRFAPDTKAQVKELFNRRMAAAAVGAAVATPAASIGSASTTAASSSPDNVPPINSGSSIVTGTAPQGSDVVGVAQTALPGIADTARKQ